MGDAGLVAIDTGVTIPEYGNLNVPETATIEDLLVPGKGVIENLIVPDTAFINILDISGMTPTHDLRVVASATSQTLDVSRGTMTGDLTVMNSTMTDTLFANTATITTLDAQTVDISDLLTASEISIVNTAGPRLTLRTSDASAWNGCSIVTDPGKNWTTINHVDGGASTTALTITPSDSFLRNQVLTAAAVGSPLEIVVPQNPPEGPIYTPLTLNDQFNSVAGGIYRLTIPCMNYVFPAGESPVPSNPYRIDIVQASGAGIGPTVIGRIMPTSAAGQAGPVSFVFRAAMGAFFFATNTSTTPFTFYMTAGVNSCIVERLA